MANISITRRCDRGCSFCFAAQERRRGQLDMSSEVFEDALDFLERSGIPDARLLGGEPTLHPGFVKLAQRALDRGFALTVMTGGLVPDEALAYLASLPAHRVRVFLNAATPGKDDGALVAAQERLCEILGPRVEPGITLVSADDDPGFLLEWVERFGLRPAVRLGVAHPIAGGANTSVPDERLRAVGARIEEFVAEAEAHGVSVVYDCGITPCMFSADFVSEHPDVMAEVGTHCAPIVDVLPEGDTVACYALSSLARIPLDGVSRVELITEFRGALPEGRYIFSECAECEHRIAGRCTGGCRARRVRAADGGGD